MRRTKRQKKINDPGGSLWFWKMTGTFGLGHITYAPGQLVKEGPFTNPARMIEDIMGRNPAPILLDGRSESDFQADVWSYAGWWDKRDR